MDIGENIRKLRQEIPGRVKIIAVTKTKSPEQIMEAYRNGQTAFGENRVQEMLEKKEKLPDDIEWHMVGHLQSNKLKTIAPFIALIHSVDSFKLLRMIEKEGRKIGRVIPCLLQMHIAAEETKYGLDMGEARQIIESEEFKEMRFVKVCGLMGMATFTEDMEQVRAEFRGLAASFSLLKQKYFAGKEWFREISMGMSGDYRIAVEEGSTMVRIGSLIFGERPCALD